MADLSPIPQLALYRSWLKEQKGLSFETYEEMWQWSVSDVEAFWESIWHYRDVQSPTPYECVLCEDNMPGAVWFKGARVNLAQQAFRHVEAAEATGQPAIIAENELGEREEVSWSELKRKSLSLALELKKLGVEKGDRVAAYLPNIPETVIAFMACSSIGAIWSLCAPDMGNKAVTDRFAQIEPKVLIAVDGVYYAGRAMDRGETVSKLQADLPSLQKTILLSTPFAAHQVEADTRFEDAVSKSFEQIGGFEPEPLEFDHPVWVLYSSGTTGLPKPIVLGQGGAMLCAFANLLHHDLGPSYEANTFGERFHWFTSTGWVMWNAQISGLQVGTTICIYNGSPSGTKTNPDWGVLWRFAARNKVTFFGSGAAFYANCEKAGLELSECGDLSKVRALGSTGSPLAENTQIWGTKQFEKIGVDDIWWNNISGGTELGSCFCIGNRELPVVPGQMQCRELGSAVEAWNDDGEAVIDAVGELVCVRPTPGMPLYFWGDADNKRYKASYFEKYPGVWCHGDWIKIQSDGSCIIYGRSDATINRHGVRMGTSEIYDAVEELDEILDSMVLDLEFLGRESKLLLFVVLREGVQLDEGLADKIRQAIRTGVSPRFLPDVIQAAPEIPRTLSGKKQEIPMKKLFLGQDANKVLSRDTMANPHVVDWYIESAETMNAGGR